jgi:hypothetical protein
MGKAFVTDFVITTLLIGGMILLYEFLFKGGASAIPSGGGAAGLAGAIGKTVSNAWLDALGMGALTAVVVSLVRAAGMAGRGAKG